MAKDINIHVKTTGTQQVQQDLQQVTQGANKFSENVEQMGSRSSRALEWFASGIKSLAGPLGFAALVMAIANVAGKISQFFSDLKNRCDEAVTNLQNLRKSFEGIFEAMDAFDEKSRKQVTK
jgi:methyl-accepting chemotaxis protein